MITNINLIYNKSKSSLLKDIKINSEVDLLLDSQDISKCLDNFKVSKALRKEITGIYTGIVEGEFVNTWVTYSNKPYSNFSLYYKLS